MSFTVNVYSCSICGIQKFSLNKYLRHIELMHQHSANFTVSCRLEGCIARYKRVQYLRTHMSNKHADIYEREMNGNHTEIDIR